MFEKYDYNDMVKVGCHDCDGCSECCRNMGTSILVDPHDAYELTTNLGVSFEKLLQGAVELHMENGLILPNLCMRGPDGAPEEYGGFCSFLNGQGRCAIHEFRPGICRLFPLGRNYEGDEMNYFVVEDACPAKNKTKMKVVKWIEPDNPKAYHQFLIDWHRLTKNFRAELLEMEDEEQVKSLSMVFLKLFYLMPYEKGDFYSQFYERMKKINS